VDGYGIPHSSACCYETSAWWKTGWRHRPADCGRELQLTGVSQMTAVAALLPFGSVKLNGSKGVDLGSCSEGLFNSIEQCPSGRIPLRTCNAPRLAHQRTQHPQDRTRPSPFGNRFLSVAAMHWFTAGLTAVHSAAAILHRRGAAGTRWCERARLIAGVGAVPALAPSCSDCRCRSRRFAPVVSKITNEAAAVE
jgi:hypothetical protein